jgi:hypothetical protein
LGINTRQNAYGHLIATVRDGLLNLIVVKKGKKDKEKILVEEEEEM